MKKNPGILPAIIQTTLLNFSVDPNIAKICCVNWTDKYLRTNLLAAKLFNTDVSVKCIMWELCRSHWCHVWKRLLYSNNINRIRWVFLGLSQDRGLHCTNFFENLSINSLKQGLSSDTIFNIPPFLLLSALIKLLIWFDSPRVWKSDHSTEPIKNLLTIQTERWSTFYITLCLFFQQILTKPSTRVAFKIDATISMISRTCVHRTMPL